MDTWGFVIFAIGLILYFVTKKKAFWLFVSGTGLGIVIGAVWAMVIFSNLTR